MPLPSEHSARLRNPDDFDPDSFRRTNGGTIYGHIKVPASIGIIWGKLKGKSKPDDPPLPQALRFPKDKWTVDEAKKWLKDNDVKYISFEPATDESKSDLNKEIFMYVDPNKMERRTLPKANIRLDDDGDSPKIVGYAALFNTWADIGGGWFKESIRQGAFTKTIKENDIRALKNHNEDHVLGRNKAKPSPTLTLREDSKGLAVEIHPPDTTYANDLLISMRRGDINQMSFGFMVNKQEMDFEKDERILIDVTLFDVSVVTFPAYPTTSAEVRSAFEQKRKKETDPEPTWKELDKIIEKIKSGESLIPDEQREIMSYLPDLSPPAASHAEIVSPPAANHADANTRKNKDRISQLLIKAELAAPSISTI